MERKSKSERSVLPCCEIETRKPDASLTPGDTLSTFKDGISASSTPPKKKNVDGKEKNVYCLTKNFLKRKSFDESSIQLVKKLLTDDVSKSGTIEIPRRGKHNLDSQCFKMALIDTFYETVTRNALRNEVALNVPPVRIHRPHVCLKIPQQQNHSVELNDHTYRNNFRTLLPVSDVDITGEEYNYSQQLNLLCTFTKHIDSKRISSNFNNSWTNEHIKMILSMTFNITVAHNIITISDENNQTIQLFFRNPIKAKIDYNSLTSSKNSSLQETFYSIDSLKNSNNIKNVQTYFSKHPVIINSIKNKRVYGSTMKGSVNVKGNYLPLQKPLLLNYTISKEVKQLLMYKADSVPHYSEKETRNFCQILEDLISRSVEYDGEPINLVFDPLEIINNSKQEERDDYSIGLHSSEGKHDLTGNLALSKCACTVKQIQTLDEVMKGNIEFGTEESKTVTNSTVDSKQRSKIPIGRHAKCFQASTSNFRSLTKKSVNETYRENNEKLKTSTKEMSRTAFKRVNVRKIVNSEFRNFFHFYSLIGGYLRSGTVITKSNSNFWLKEAGVARDSTTLKLAEDVFIATAGRKVVLNIYDYLQFLIAFARERKMIVAELVMQMMDMQVESANDHQKSQLFYPLKNHADESSDICSEGNKLGKSQSLPNLWII